MQVFFSRKKKIAILVILDSILITIAHFLGVLFLQPYISVKPTFFWLSLIFTVAVYLICGKWFHLFTRVNRYTSLNEMVGITTATTITAILQLLFTGFSDYTFSRRYVIFTYLLSTMFIIGSRLTWRVYVEWHNRKLSGVKKTAKNTLIIGAGEGGRILYNSLASSATNSDIRVVGFIDDDVDRAGTYINGIKVLGTTEDIPKLVKQHHVEMLTLAIPSISATDLEKIIRITKPLGIKVNSMPDMEEVARGHLTISRMREIDIVDLLGREEVKLDLGKIKEQLTDKVILVTGAGGSIGSEICRQVIKFKPKKLILLGHGENSIYLIERELKNQSPAIKDTEIIPLIAEIQDRNLMFDVMKQHKPDIIYHAAAHKHVPLMEANPSEAVKNNVYGTMNVAEAAKAHQVGNFVMISTDKAVNPPNVMGSTKRIAEMIVMGLNEKGHTKFSAVRFGNVLGSRGSVIPVFREQIAKGGPVTVTDFRMTRYFMTIPEASRLVIQSGALARGGEIFILDMGEPVKILDLAKKMIELSGYDENQIKIEESGIRPGEKLYEELLVDKERQKEQVYEKIFIGNVRGFTLEQVKEFLTQLPEEPDELAKALVKYANASSE